MEIQVLKTKLQEKRFKRDLSVYSDYEELMSLPGQSATEVCKLLMQKYEINSQSTIYVIIKRVRDYYRKEARS